MIASLDFPQYVKLLGSAYSTARKSIFVLGDWPRRVIELSPLDGSELGSFTPAQYSSSFHGSLAIHPATGNIWLSSNTPYNNVNEYAPDGTLIQVHDLSGRGVRKISGLAFEADGTLFVSSEYRVVISLVLP